MRILVVDDDDTLTSWVAKVLGEVAHAVDIGNTAARGRTLALSMDYDLALVDLDLPDGNGLQIVHELRRAGKSMPILIMTGRDDDEGIIACLDAGADDYLVKPVANGVLRARVRAALRRGGAAVLDTLAIGELRLDRLHHTVLAGGVPLELSAKEFTLLEYFMLHPEQTVSRADLLEHVWRIRFDTQTNVIDTTVSRLRQKLAAAVDTPRLATVRGVGYALTATPVPPR